MLDDICGEILTRLEGMSEDELMKVVDIKNDSIGKPVWIPNPGPQTEAYESKADILLYGGEPGGGKTGLGLGLALTRHHRSLVVRKQFTDLNGVIDNLAGMLPRNEKGEVDGLVRGTRPKFKKKAGSVINFQGMGQTGEIDTGKQGDPHDLIFVDEAAQLAEVDIRLLLGWNRISTDSPKGQRCRVVLGSNPPTSPTGDWLGTFFGAWFDDKHPNPADFGELRWYYFDEKGDSVETLETKPFKLNEITIYPKSRTYIPAKLEDNPFQDPDEYRGNLQQLPEPFRTQLLSGNFLAARKDQDYQVIPTIWVREAMERWKENPNPPAGVPMCTMGCDMVGSGKGVDDAIIANRYDYWFDEMIATPSRELPDGNLSGTIIMNRKDNALIVIDMGGGYGGATWTSLTMGAISTEFLRAYKGAEAGVGRSKDNQLPFFNKRSQAYWLMRELLNPSQLGGSPACLPPDSLLLTDLTAPTFEVTSRGIQVEPKAKVILKLSRSPDRGDAVVMANVEGHRGLTPKAHYQTNFNSSRLQTKAVMDYSKRR